MSRMENLLAVRRQLLPEQHETVLSRTSLVTEWCGELSLTWFDLGTAMCGLVERGEYRDALAQPGGALWRQDVGSVARKISSKLTEIPTGNDSLDATVSNIDFTGKDKGRYLRIAYMLDSAELMAENQALRDYIDAENQSDSDWQPYYPLINIARIKRQEATDDVLEAVWQIGHPYSPCYLLRQC